MYRVEEVHFVVCVCVSMGGETGKAIVVPTNGKTITIETIHAYLADKVAKYKYPSKLEIVAEFPMTATGKIKKSELKELYLAN